MLEEGIEFQLSSLEFIWSETASTCIRRYACSFDPMNDVVLDLWERSSGRDEFGEIGVEKGLIRCRTGR